MEKTISYLNSKIIYRLIKVFYIFSFLIAFVLFFCFSYYFLSRIDLNNTYVQCNDNRIINSDDLIESKINVDFSINSNDDYKVRAICEHPDYKRTEKSLKNRNGEPFTETQLTYIRNQIGITTVDGVNYKLEPNYKFIANNHVNTRNILIVIATLAGIIIFFEIVKRTFYYIVLGSIRPKK